MTDAELITQLEIELSLVNDAIAHVLKTGERYEIGTGSSRRVFEADLTKLRKMQNDIRAQLRTLDDDDAVVLGASW